MLPQSGTAPGTLIRTPEGRITFWSEELQRRYGFSADEALGQVAHELLRSSHWQTHDEIEAALATRSEWRGGLIAYRADDQPVIVATRWHLHRGADGLGSLVSEVHADIAFPGTTAGDEMADVIATIAHQVSQPLAALGGFIDGTQRVARSAWPDDSLLASGLSNAAAQVERAYTIIARFRVAGETLRTPPPRALHARFAEAVVQSERLVREAHDVQAASRLARDGSTAARQHAKEAREERHRGSFPGAISAERALVLQSIQVYRRRLALLRSGRSDVQAERLLTQLLKDEEAKLLSLDPDTACMDRCGTR